MKLLRWHEGNMLSYYWPYPREAILKVEGKYITQVYNITKTKQSTGKPRAYFMEYIELSL